MLHERVGAAIADYRRSGASHVAVTHAGVIKAALVRAGHPDGWKAVVGFGASIRLPPE